MADRRIQPERLQGNTVFKPSAGASETYVPIREGSNRSGLRDAIEALSSVAPRLERFGVSYAEDQAKQETKAAVVAAETMTEAATWKEAVEKGVVDPGASPVFRRVWAETRGRVDATAAVAEWEREMLAPDSTILNNEDGNAAAKWIAEKRAAWLNGKDQDYQLGSLRTIQNAENQLLQKHAQIWSNRRFNEAKDDLGLLMTDTIREGIAAGKADTDIMKDIVERSVPHQFAGLPRADVNAVIAQTVISYAKRVGETDPVQAYRILDIAYADRPDLTKPGGTVPGVGKVPAIGANIEDARRAIDAATWTREQREHLRMQRTREEQTRAFFDRVAPALASGQPLSAAQLTELFRINPGEGRATMSQQQTQADRARVEAIRSAEDEITDRLARELPVDMPWLLRRFGGMKGSGDMVNAAARILKTVETAEISAAESRYLPYVYAAMLEAPSPLDAVGSIGLNGITIDGKQVRLSDGTVRRLSEKAMTMALQRDPVSEGVWRNVTPSLRDPTVPTAMPQNGRYQTQAYFAYQREIASFVEDYTQKNGARPSQEMVRREAQLIGNEITNWVRAYQQLGGNAELFEADQFIRGQHTKPLEARPAQPTAQPEAAKARLPEFPMQFAETERSLMGRVLGEGSAAARNMIPKQYVPKEARNPDGVGTRRVLPSDQQITALATVLVNDPEAAGALIKEFDAEFGTNAAYHYYTRWRAQQPNR